MSGGEFDYNQYHISRIAEEVEELVKKNPYNYSPEVIEKFKEGVVILKKAYIYAQRIDWLVSGDDGEDSFLERLEGELGELKA